MFPILITTHGNLGKELIETSKLIMGEQKELYFCSLHQGDDYAAWREELEKVLIKIDTGKGVLVLVDLFGGSPSNSIALLLKKRNVNCITGANLPILIEALSNRDRVSTIEELVDCCVHIGKDSIFDLSSFLTEKFLNQK